MNRNQRETIRKALEHIPENCEYHGTQIERISGFNSRPEPCCETGKPSVDRKKAIHIIETEETQ